MWCEKCKHETNNEICELCGDRTEPSWSDGKMWCEKCKHETNNEICELCGDRTEPVVPTEI